MRQKQILRRKGKKCKDGRTDRRTHTHTHKEVGKHGGEKDKKGEKRGRRQEMELVIHVASRYRRYIKMNALATIALFSRFRLIAITVI